MASEKVFKLPNLQGGIDILTESGSQITEEQLNAVNRDRRSGFNYISAGASPEQIENHYLELLMDAYPDELDSAESKAKSLSNEYLGIKTPETKAQELLSDKVKQYAQPVQGTAGISNALFEQGLKQRLTPWASRKRNDGLYDDKAWWVNKDINGFNNKANELVREIELADGSPASRLSIINGLRNDNGYGTIQATEEFDRVNKGEDIAARVMGVPNASADEGINTYLMQASGLDAEAWNRGDPIYATDHMVTIGDGTKIGIDSQRRMGSRAMNIGVLTGQNNLQAAIRQLRQAIALNNGTLREVLGGIRSGRSREDKLLQTLDYNPSNWYRSKHDKIRKDMLMSSDMSSWRQNPNEAATFTAQRHGPYNPTLGAGWEMYDLNALRADIMDRPMGELKDMGIQFGGQKGKLSMNITQPSLQRYANTSMLDSGIISMARRLRR